MATVSCGQDLGTLHQPPYPCVQQAHPGKSVFPLLPRQTESPSAAVGRARARSTTMGLGTLATRAAGRGYFLSTERCSNQGRSREVCKRRFFFTGQSLSYLRQNPVANLRKIRTPGLGPRPAQSEPLGTAQETPSTKPFVCRARESAAR